MINKTTSTLLSLIEKSAPKPWCDIPSIIDRMEKLESLAQAARKYFSPNPDCKFDHQIKAYEELKAALQILDGANK